jgi:uncharacterized protein YodC (DUF2158 family)
MAAMFQSGDPVREKGGSGPDMLVEGYDGSGKVICSFWEGVSRGQKNLSEALLEKVPPISSLPPAGPGEDAPR